METANLIISNIFDLLKILFITAGATKVIETFGKVVIWASKAMRGENIKND